MSPARHWYERLLGGVLALFGLALVLPIAAFGLWFGRMYTVGLSVQTGRDLLIAFAVGGLAAILGGIALLRRS